MKLYRVLTIICFTATASSGWSATMPGQPPPTQQRTIVVPKAPVAAPVVVPTAPAPTLPNSAVPVGKPGLVNPLATPPTPPMAPKPAVADTAAKPMLVTPFDRPEKLQGLDPNKAKVDMSNVKQNIDTTGLTIGAPEQKGGLSDLQREQGSNTLQTEDNKKASEARNFGLVGETVIKGADADTFGGERINSQHTGDTGNFRGSSAGNAGGGTAGGGSRGGSNSTGGNTVGSTSSSSSSANDKGPSRSSSSPDGMSGGSGGRGGGGGGGGSEKTDPTIDQMLRQEGGTPTGNAAKDTAELSYAQSTSGAAYQATKDMTAEERKAYWADEKNTQGIGTDKKPREDAMGSGSGAPVGTTRAMQEQNARAAEKALEARKNKAGGNSDDQRVEQTGSGGPVMETVGNDDNLQKVQGAGTINIDRILEINKTVNPVRN